MVDPDTETNQARPAADVHNQKVVDRLVFAALREQTRARRWRPDLRHLHADDRR